MNPLTNVKNITKLNEIELSSGSIHKKSWHDMYKDSAWIFIGGLAYGLTEGDIITVFSQYGEIVNINLVRDKKTGKTKGFCFLCYANQKSTILAVDNLNGIKLCSRTIRVDHVANYKPPKEDDRDDEITKMLKSEGCAPQHLMMNENSMASNDQAKKKKLKKEKKEKKKKKRKHSSAERESESKTLSIVDAKIKKEKPDPGYDKYDMPPNKYFDNGRKQRYEDKKYEHSLSESSHSRERFRARSDQSHHMSDKNDDLQHESKLKYRSKERPISESQRKETHRERDKQEASSLRKDKRIRSSSSSSDDSSRSRKKKGRYNDEKSQPKSRHSNSERRLEEYKQSSSSSSDEDSSSQSSTDDEKDSRNSKRDRYKRSEEEKSYQKERRDKPDHRSDDSNYATHRSGHSGKTERDFEYRSKDKYRSDERDSHYRDSYHRSRYDKR